jgi:hypothetical protein
VYILQHPPADAQNHWSVPAKQRFKSCFIMLIQKGLKQLTVGGVCSLFEESHLAEIAHDGFHFFPRLAVPFRHLLLPGGRRRVEVFS